MDKIFLAIFEHAKKQSLSFLLLLAGFYYFYAKDAKNQQISELHNVKLQLQIDTLNRRVDMCRSTYEMVLLNQVAENTSLLKEVKEIIGASGSVDFKHKRSTTKSIN